MAEISILYIGVKPSPIMAELMSSKKYSIDVIVNNILDFEMSPQQAITFPRAFHFSNIYKLEKEVSTLLRKQQCIGTILSQDLSLLMKPQRTQVY